VTRAAINDCWNTIGVRGDSTCPELREHVHCRNCPVYAAAAATLLDAELPPEYLERWTSHVSQPRSVPEAGILSVIVFRIDAEYLALPTPLFQEIAGLRAIHSLPHCTDGVVLGVANIRGQLVVCVSLGHMLRLESTAERMRDEHRPSAARLLVMERDDTRTAFPVDEVYGVHRFHPREFADVPTTIAKAASRFIKAVISQGNKSVGVLEGDLLLDALTRRFATSTAT
jgi:chemotaxis-related protein WspD